MTKNMKSCQWLFENLSNIIVLDAGIIKPGDKGRYRPAAIIPDARRFDISNNLSDEYSNMPNMMCSEQVFQAEMRQLGINDTDTVVVYDDKGLFSAARAWWMFKAMGFDQVFILDGGLKQWMALGYETVTEYASVEHIGNFTAQSRAHYFIDKEQVLAGISDPEVMMLDARGEQRFKGIGKEPRAGMRSGHIPHSVNLPYTSVLTEQGLLKPLPELAQLLNSLGVNEQVKTLQFSCGSGVTACILALVALECGYSSLHVYDGSWSEWGQLEDYPVAVSEN
ncbi:sulfurtransferase [Pseudoalteromonas luteoviolacea]|uniref:sulfurtransferase n=1 Tax=Pseudoalteromonas luteoviolacea TaxID=43657 RepID=UPI001B37F0EE|nr:sulfurtransferase [Pseudoalteromonas luteoviolacea]MBQ4811686.1 sulfurtransferase [Pseudoalteromonas luteoviolacea]